MINPYESVHLSSQETGYELINYTGANMGPVTFKKELTQGDIASETFVKVKAVIDGVQAEGFIELNSDERFLERIRTLDPTEASKKINDYMLSNKLGSSQEYLLLQGLMHLGFSKESYDADPLALAKRLFTEGTFVQQTNKFKELTSALAADCLPALNHLYEKLAMDTVKKDGFVLGIIPEGRKTLEICEAAVKQNGDVLSIVPDVKKNLEMCEAAVKQSGLILAYVPERMKTLEMCEAAVKQSGYALRYVPERIKTLEICEAAVKQSGLILAYVPERMKTFEMCEAAVNQNGEALGSVPDDKKTLEICEAAVKQNGYALEFVPDDKKTLEICRAAVKQNGEALGVVPDDKKTLEICEAAVEQNLNATRFVPDKLKNSKEFIAKLYQETIFISLLSGQSKLTTSPIEIGDLHRLKENYKWIDTPSNLQPKERNILNGKEAIQYLKEPTEINLKKIKEKMKSSRISEDNQKVILDHLFLESRCLKALQLDEVESLRLVSPLSKEIVNYRHEDIANFLQGIITTRSKMPMNTFLNQLALVSKGKKECILPAIIVSNYQANLSGSDKLQAAVNQISVALVALKSKLSADSKSMLRPIMELEIALSKTGLTELEQATILANCLNDESIIDKVQMMKVICKIQPERIRGIEDFSIVNLMNIVTEKLIRVGFLADTQEAKEKFAAIFLNSRIPSAIFTYAEKFIGNEQMKPVIRRFVSSVLSGRFNEERNSANSHAKYLTPAQKATWESGAIQKVGAKGLGEIVFNPTEFLHTKLVIDNHGGPLFANIVSILSGAVAASSRENNRLEKLCLQLIYAKDQEGQLDVLRQIDAALNKPEYEGLEFKNDVSSQIQLMTTTPKKLEGSKIIDSDDWQDLFFCGTEVAGSCQRVDGDPGLNRCLMGYVLDGKVRILKIAGPDGKIIARSIFKIILDKNNHPALFFERVYPGFNAEQEKDLKEFARKRALEMGLALYEHGEREPLHSIGNTAPYEYEDAGGGVTNGRYTIMGQKVS